MLSVLYVDDEPALLEIGRLFLETSNQCRVTTVLSGEEALDILRRKRFDAIVSDYQMPVMDGLDLLRQLRESGFDIPFILFTGRGREEVVVRAFELGADFYLQKGGDPRTQFAELLHKVMQAVRRREAERTARESTEGLHTIQERLALALDAGQIGLYDWEIQAGRFFCSELFSSLVGLAPGAVAPSMEGWLASVHPDDRQRVEQRIREALAGEPVDEVEYRVIWPNGTVRWLTERTTVLSEGEQTVRVIGAVSDQTDRRAATEAMVESERQLATLMNNLPGLVYRCRSDRDWTMLFVSDGARELTGYSPEDLIESSRIAYNDLIHPYDREQVWTEIQQATGLGQPFRMEYRITTADGDERWVWEQGQGVPIGAPQPEFLEGVVFDITDRKRAEDELHRANDDLAAAEEELHQQLQELEASQARLRESERWSRSLLDSVGDMIYIHDLDGAIIDANRAACERLGYSREELLGMTAASVDSPDEFVHYGDRVQHLREGGQAVFESVHLTRNREPIPVEVSARLIEIDGTTLVISIARDLTDRRASEAARAASAAELDRFFRHSIDLFCIADTQGNFLRLSTEWERTLGYRLEELEGRVFFEFVHPDDLAATRLTLDGLSRGESVVNFVNRYRRADGEYRFIEWRSFPYEDRIYAAARDITDRRRTEEALLRANEQLNLLSSITRHDLQNRMMALSGYLHLARTADDATARAEYLDRVHRHVMVMAAQLRFTKDYQDLGAMAPAWQEVQTVLRAAASGAELDGIAVEFAGRRFEVLADGLLGRVFGNLLENAVRHGERVTRIRCVVDERPEGLVVGIEDDGVGVPHDEKEQIFQRGVGQGTGLGLFLAREVLAITGIGITETGIPGRGARFELTVPCGAFRPAGPDD